MEQEILDNILATKKILVNGKIIRWPKKDIERRSVLIYIALKIPQKNILSEKDINELIMQNIIFEDYALIRRELIEHKYIQRTKDCREYWQTIQ
jgi:hypothetical protein